MRTFGIPKGLHCSQGGNKYSLTERIVVMSCVFYAEVSSLELPCYQLHAVSR
jgi:hypothetical protein